MMLTLCSRACWSKILRTWHVASSRATPDFPDEDPPFAANSARAFGESTRCSMMVSLKCFIGGGGFSGMELLAALLLLHFLAACWQTSSELLLPPISSWPSPSAAAFSASPAARASRRAATATTGAASRPSTPGNNRSPSARRATATAPRFWSTPPYLEALKSVSKRPPCSSSKPRPLCGTRCERRHSARFAPSRNLCVTSSPNVTATRPREDWREPDP
mmetsp:Transcript_60290/g.153146  ORF Transcript_60290/g.153146 Transcript_60290/m.153146 type:complete len:219 (-) Transcript_60290:1178-1834(-)